VRRRPCSAIPGTSTGSSDSTTTLWQGSSFACLPLLRELRIEAEADQGADMYDGIVTANLAGLPAGLQTLKVSFFVFNPYVWRCIVMYCDDWFVTAPTCSGNSACPGRPTTSLQLALLQ